MIVDTESPSSASFQQYYYVRREKARFLRRDENPGRKLSFQPEALGAAQEVTNGLKHYEKRPLREVSESRGPQCAVNTEQAPETNEVEADQP